MKQRLLNFRDFLLEYVGIYLIVLMIAAACTLAGFWLIKGIAVVKFGVPLTDEQVFYASLAVMICYVAILAKVRR